MRSLRAKFGTQCRAVQGPVGSEPQASQAVTAFTSAAAQTQSNIDALVAIIDGAHAATVIPASDALDAAEALARHQDRDGGPKPDTRRLITGVNSLRQIERAIVTGATNLGARDGVKLASQS